MLFFSARPKEVILWSGSKSVSHQNRRLMVISSVVEHDISPKRPSATAKSNMFYSVPGLRTNEALSCPKNLWSMKPRWQFGLLGCWEGEAEEIAKLGKGEDNYFDDEIANMKFKRKNRLTFLFNHKDSSTHINSPLNWLSLIHFWFWPTPI